MYHKNTTFLFVFLTYLPVFLLKFWSGELVGCIIKFRIQRVATQHTFNKPHYPKNKKYLKKCDDDIIRRALLIKIWVKTLGDMSKIRTKKVVFFMIPIPKFILKKCLRPIRYFKFKAISLANTWWHGIWIKVKRPILSWNFL